MAMDSKNTVLELLDDVLRRAGEMKRKVESGNPGRCGFLNEVKEIEEDCLFLRAAVIRESRAAKRGLKTDGSPDMRFNRNRRTAARRADLRFSHAS